MRRLIVAAALVALALPPSLTLADEDGPGGGGHGYGPSHEAGQGQPSGTPGNGHHSGNGPDRGGNGPDRGGKGPDHNGAPMGRHFGDTDRHAVADYFGPDMHSGRCPPGLAKKGNGCQPPGQARKWRMGHPLPSGVARYPLPPELLGRLAPPPSGYEYTRVAGDVLMIATGTSMVVDAIRDIGR